jgi:hypothetical protein
MAPAEGSQSSGAKGEGVPSPCWLHQLDSAFCSSWYGKLTWPPWRLSTTGRRGSRPAPACLAAACPLPAAHTGTPHWLCYTPRTALQAPDEGPHKTCNRISGETDCP